MDQRIFLDGGGGSPREKTPRKHQKRTKKKKIKNDKSRNASARHKSNINFIRSTLLSKS